MKQNRRTFLKYTSQSALALGLLGFYNCGNANEATEHGEEGHIHEHDEAHLENHDHSTPWFQISLAQWSLHRTIRGGKMDNLDFAMTAKDKFGISAIEYVNQFFKDKANDTAYLSEMKKRAADNGVKSLLIMVDGEGNLGDLDDKKRTIAVENHYKWLEAAKFLGCHSIRVNAAGEGTAEDVGKAEVNGLGRLAERGATMGLNVIVENHGGYSSNGEWLSNVMVQANMPTCGTLPDFGNFCITREGGKCINEYDRYKGVTELMKYAKAVSAKSHDFNEAGEEINTDYMKMMKIVKNAGYTGYVGIEYEGNDIGEAEGIMKTKALLERVRMNLG